LITAFEAIRSVNSNAKLVLIGDGPARKSLQAQCPYAKFVGVHRGEDLASHYASGDVFLFPSLTETFGNVTTEAMASGLPVLAYDYAAAGELIRSGYNGFLAPLDDPALFVNQAKLLAGDRKPLATIGARARESALALGWEKIVEQIESVFLATI